MQTGKEEQQATTESIRSVVNAASRISAMIPTSYIDSLLASVDIVELIGQTVPLRKTGSNYSGVCPFHKADKGSFTVAPEKRFYHCFGCGAHGSAINFVIQQYGMSFVEAVEFLGDMLGWPSLETSPARRASQKKLVNKSEAFDVALKYYRQKLKESPKAIDFLKNRGISGKTAAKFGLGFAPEAWHNLEAAFGSDYRSSNVLESGLVIQTDQGRVYDRYRDRLILPFFDNRRQIVGLIGRSIGSAEPTFLLPPRNDSPLSGFDIFGLSQARSAIRESASAIVAQGCLDVLALHERGFDNSVSIARSRTVTSDHVSVIFRSTSLILFCFDATANGNRLAWRAMEAALPVLTDKNSIRFVLLPDGQSPSNTVSRGDSLGEFRLSLKSAIPLSEFLVQTLTQRHDIKSVEGRAAMMRDATDLLEKIRAPFIKQFIRERLDALCQDDLELLSSTEEHDACLDRALSTAVGDIVIVSPWISRQGVERFDFCKKVSEARQRGVSITIFTDLELNQDRSNGSPSGDLIADGSYAALVAAGARIEFVCKIHSKILVVDESMMCIEEWPRVVGQGFGFYK